MIPIRVMIPYFLWRFGLRPILPRQIINRVPILDSGDKLVPVYSTAKLHLRPISGTVMYLRENCLRLLNAAANNLPRGYSLILAEGFRSLARQKELWDKQINIVRADNPRLSLEEIERITRLSVAKPTGMGGGHQTGGAVDVTLSDESGYEIDMGTRLQEFSRLTPTRVRGLLRSIAKNRQTLVRAMSMAGFSNFPGEWWHFSYGDQMWAAYLRKSSAIYGPIEPPAEKSAAEQPLAYSPFLP
jgi:zinc D-Ala-D-Ala dipeptidase